ncbi:MAG: PorV/PorQ family protein [bacterium]
MKNSKFIFTIAVALIGLVFASSGRSQEKLAQTGFQFLSVGTDARATAMGEAFTTVSGSPMAMFYNPAGMAVLEPFLQFSANHMQWIADINYFSGALSINPNQGQYGTFGLSFMFVDYGDIIGTVVAANEQGFIETGNISPSAVAVGLGYAKAITDRFSVGGHVKYVNQSLGEPFVPETDSTQTKIDFSTDAIAFDFGTIYKTGFKSLTFGMTLRNFSQEIKFVREGFQLPLTFKIGFSINAFDLLGAQSDNQSWLISVEAINPRAFSEYFSVGTEYKFMNRIALRGGYVYNQDDYGITTGFGVTTKKVKLDYSYTPFDVFKDVHRFSVKFGF